MLPSKLLMRSAGWIQGYLIKTRVFTAREREYLLDIVAQTPLGKCEFCVLGAIWYCSDKKWMTKEQEKWLIASMNSLVGGDITVWNDAWGREEEQVLSVLKQAEKIVGLAPTEAGGVMEELE